MHDDGGEKQLATGLKRITETGSMPSTCHAFASRLVKGADWGTDSTSTRHGAIDLTDGDGGRRGRAEVGSIIEGGQWLNGRRWCGIQAEYLLGPVLFHIGHARRESPLSGLDGFLLDGPHLIMPACHLVAC